MLISNRKMSVCLYLFPLLLLFSNSTRCAPNVNFTHFQLVQTWPRTFCLDPSVKCITALPTGFTLHGLWPADANGNTVTGCTKKRPDMAFVQSKVGPNLEAAWPSINANIENDRFWIYQWREHGSCGASKVLLLNYFGRAVYQKMKVDLLDVLTAANITPNNQTVYGKSAIEKAVKNAIGDHDVYISCRLHGNERLLFEIHICLDDYAMKYISCPKRSDERGCGKISEKRPSIKFPTE